jgi:hypothetical protein
MRRLILTLIGLFCCGVPAAAEDVTFYAARDTMIPEAHKMNNDGGWGYGWIKVSQGAHNYGLIGFDVAGLISTDPEQVLDPVEDIEKATIKLRVAQNHLAEGGQIYDVYEWRLEEANEIEDWREGYNRFDLFSYCSQSQWARPAAQNDPEVPDGYDFCPGAIWTCSVDNDTDDGSTSCPTPAASYEWDVEPADGIHLGFALAPASTPTPNPFPSPAASFYGQKQYQDEDEDQDVYCGELDPEIKRNCNPLCGKSIECFGTEPVAGATPNPPERCYRTIEIDVTESLRRFVDAGVGDASWLIRRRTNSGAGAFHYFSREGAVCILGECGRAPAPSPNFFPDYKQLMPVLVVDLKDGVSPPSPIVEPAVECWRSYPGRCPTPAAGGGGCPTPVP